MNERIKTIRQIMKMTQADFGSHIGISQNYVWMLETGVREPSDRTIRDICREYGINETWLRTGEGEMRRSFAREEEMAGLFRDLMASRPESFRAALITTLLRFDPDGPEWALLEDIYKKIAAETKKTPEP